MTQFIVAPDTDVDVNGNLTSLAQAVLYNSTALTNLANGGSYRAFRLSDASPVILPIAPPSSLSLADFSRDKIIFDSGAALGKDYADIPFDIVAPANQIIQVRAYSLRDNGATSTAWIDLGTTDGSGNLSGTIPVVLNESWYRREARIKVAPATTVSNAMKFSVGHVFAIWGQSEDHRMVQTGFSNTTPETLLTTKQQVARLVLRNITGRDSTNPLKVVGVDTLPSGATVSGRTITVSGTGTFEDWDIQDYRILTASNAYWKLKQCIIREVVGSLAPSYLIQATGKGTIETYKCTIYGLPGSSLDACVREDPGSQYGRTIHHYTRIEGSPGDGAKLVAGKFYNCYITIQQNLKKIPTLWSAGTSYAVDDYVYITVGSNTYAYASLTAGNTGNQPPTDGDPNNVSTLWRRQAPHSDLVTLVEAREPIIFDRCVLTFGNAMITDGAVGLTNNLRIDANPGGTVFSGGVLIRNTLMDRNPTNNGIPIQIASTVVWNGQITFERCQFRPRNASNLTMQIPSTGPTVTISNCEDLNTGAALTLPANAIAGTSAIDNIEDDYQMIMHDRTNRGLAGIVHKFPTQAQPYTASMLSMMNTFAAERPGEKVAVLWHVLSGTGFTELFSDGATARYGVDDWAVHSYGTSDGVSVGVTSSTWYASPGALAAQYGEAFYQAATGLTTAGAALPLNGSNQRMVLNGTGQQITCDRLWVDLYDYAKTRWLLWGPHRFEPDVTMLDATHLANGTAWVAGQNNELCRISVRAAVGSAPGNAIFLPMPFDPLSYENGKSNGSGGWTDIGHPSDTSLDGLTRRARLHCHGLLRAANLTRYKNPQYDTCYWEPSGTYVEISSSAGPITTPRKARSLPPLTGQAHYGDVAGWQLNGRPVAASLVAGKTRIFPLSGSFSSWDKISFGEGGATGMVVLPTDFVNRFWMESPVVDQGQYGVEGLSLSPLPSQSILGSTLSGNAMFTSVAGQLTYIKDAANWPTGAAGQPLTMFFDGRLNNTGGSQYIASMEGSPQLSLDVTTSGGLRLTLKDSSGTALMTTASIGTIAFGVRFQLTVTFDISTTNACFVTLNGVTTQKNFTGTANGLAGASRKFRFLASGATTAANFALGDFAELAVWNEYVSGGGRPATNTNRRFQILGPAAAANSPTGATKTGGNFV